MAQINAAAAHATAVLLILLALQASSPVAASAFNITRILGNFSDFSAFSDLLTRTKLAGEINRRQTITVLALNNGAMGSISSLPSDVQRKVLAVHVVLDYYDMEKLGAMKNRSALLTTLFQSTGQATDRMGFINYTRRVGDNVMMFGSAEPGAPLTSQMVKPVASRPYNISVLQVSSAIVPPSISIGSTSNSEAKALTPIPTVSNVPALAPAPAPSDDSSADAPGPAADSPVADSPTDADGPAADSPVADGPAAADAPAHDRSNDDVSGADSVAAGAGLGAVAVLVATIILWR